MIQSFCPEYLDDGLANDSARSTGCSCCSCGYNIVTEKEKVLKEAEDNIKVVKAICKFYKISFAEFCKKVKQ